MSILDIGSALKSRFLHTEIVTEGEVAFLFVDGRFERVLPPGRYRLGERSRRRVERVPLTQPKVTFPEIEAIKTRDDVRRVTASIQVEEGRLGLAFLRGVFFGFLAPGSHVFVHADGDDPFTFDLVTPVAGAELSHPALDRVVRHPEALGHLELVQVDGGSLGLLYIDGVFARRLDPGRHVLFETGHALRVDIARPFEPVAAPERESLVQSADLVSRLLDVRVSDTERGLVFAGDNFRRFLGPGAYLFLEQTQPPVRVVLVDIREPRVKLRELQALARAPDAA